MQPTRVAAARAGLRKPPLACGCHDPAYHQCRREPLSQLQIDAAVATAHDLFALGLPPLFDVATIKALWRGGTAPSATVVGVGRMTDDTWDQIEAAREVAALYDERAVTAAWLDQQDFPALE